MTTIEMNIKGIIKNSKNSRVNIFFYGSIK